MNGNQNSLEELLDEYFDLAFEKGRNFAVNGLRVIQVRKEIISLFKPATMSEVNKPEGGE